MFVEDEESLQSLAKQYLFKLLFGKVWISTTGGGYFLNKNHTKVKELYPKEAEYLEKLKSAKNELDNHHAIFAQLLQKEEVNIFKQIWFKLIQKGVQFITIHDEIIFHSNNRIIVEQVFNDVFSCELLGINYQFKIEYLK